MEHCRLPERGGTLAPFKEGPDDGLRRRVGSIDAEPEADGLLSYLPLFRRRKGILLFFIFAGPLLAILISLPQTPVYRANASLELQGMNENFMRMGEVAPTAVNYASDAYMQTQIQILESRSLMERVRGKFIVPKIEGFPAFPEANGWRKLLHLPAQAPQSGSEPLLDEVAKSLKVRGSGMTRIIALQADSTDPELAAQFVNTVATEYIEQTLDARWDGTQRTSQWLSRQLEEHKIKMEKDEERLQEYARSSGLMFTSEKDNVAEARLLQLQSELSKAQAERVARQSRAELGAVASPESIPEILDDGTLKDFQLRFAELRRQYAELETFATVEHPQAQKLLAQINEIKTSIEKERGQILQKLRNEFDAARRREFLLTKAYNEQVQLVTHQAANSIQYNILKREVDTNRQLYEAMLQRVKDAGVASALRASNVRVVDPAVPPVIPHSPNLKLNSLLGLLGGAFGGIVLIFIQERMDRRFKNPGDLFEWMNLPELGVVPSASIDPGAVTKPRAPKKQKLLSVFQGSAIAEARSGNSLELVSWQRPFSLLSEAYRASLTSMLFSGVELQRSRAILVTSPGPGEGKTSIAANLAITWAKTKKQLLLIDGDLRRPQLHTLFESGAGRGLADILMDRTPIDDLDLSVFIRPTGVNGLALLSAGTRLNCAVNLLYSPRLPELLRRIRDLFDGIIIDAPPVLPVADARVIGRLADSIVLVVRAGQTTREEGLKAVWRFAEDGTPVLGGVLNDWNPKSVGFSYTSYAKYFDQNATDDSQPTSISRRRKVEPARKETTTFERPS